jgi:hypothetical protein
VPRPERLVGLELGPWIHRSPTNAPRLGVLDWTDGVDRSGNVTGERIPPVEEAGQGCLALLLLVLLIGLGIGSIVSYWYVFVPVLVGGSALLILVFKLGFGRRHDA